MIHYVNLSSHNDNKPTHRLSIYEWTPTQPGGPLVQAFQWYWSVQVICKLVYSRPADIPLGMWLGYWSFIFTGSLYAGQSFTWVKCKSVTLWLTTVLGHKNASKTKSYTKSVSYLQANSQFTCIQMTLYPYGDLTFYLIKQIKSCHTKNNTTSCVNVLKTLMFKTLKWDNEI